MTFKVGDRVRVISDLYGKEQLGKTGIVDEVNRPGNLDVQIEYDTPLNGVGLKKNQYRSRHLELIANAGPIRTETVTVRRLEPGVYGPLRVRCEINVPDCERPDAPPEKRVEVSLVHTDLNASDWRELARVALEIAEYLENA